MTKRPLSASSTAGLDDPARSALMSRHAHFAIVRGQCLQYPAEVAPFCSLPATASLRDWQDAESLVAAQGLAVMQRPYVSVPDGWAVDWSFDGLQMIAASSVGQPDPEVEVLELTDVPAMRELVAQTAPGPFGLRTIELGTYLGFRESGRLIAMAGERMSFPGWTEISAICTAPDARGRGLATRVTQAVAAVIERRGDRPFLHVRADNAGAIRVYESLGFVVRQQFVLHQVRLR
jgi:ribosomal protein S18 acetylase RimI-like enzyme